MIMILIFLTTFILFITINFRVSANLNYDVLSNNGNLTIKLFKYMFLFYGDFKIENNFIQIKKKNNKSFNINLKISKKQLLFLKELNKNISTKIYINSLELKTLLCLENPAGIAILSSLYSILSNLFLIKLKQNNFDITIKNNVNTGFRQNILKLDVNTTIYASILDIVWAFIITLFNNRRKNGEERRRKTEC